MEFEWDEHKNAENIVSRGISFSYAKFVFTDRKRHTVQDTRKDYGEQRFITTGRIDNRLHVVCHTPRGEYLTRIISARKANKREQREFELRGQG